MGTRTVRERPRARRARGPDRAGRATGRLVARRPDRGRGSALRPSRTGGGGDRGPVGGSPHPRLPAAVTAWVAGQPPRVDQGLVTAARQLVGSVSARSELRAAERRRGLARRGRRPEAAAREHRHRGAADRGNVGASTGRDVRARRRRRTALEFGPGAGGVLEGSHGRGCGPRGRGGVGRDARRRLSGRPAAGGARRLVRAASLRLLVNPARPARAVWLQPELAAFALIIPPSASRTRTMQATVRQASPGSPASSSSRGTPAATDPGRRSAVALRSTSTRKVRKSSRTSIPPASALAEATEIQPDLDPTCFRPGGSNGDPTGPRSDLLPSDDDDVRGPASTGAGTAYSR